MAERMWRGGVAGMQSMSEEYLGSPCEDGLYHM